MNTDIHTMKKSEHPGGAAANGIDGEIDTLIGRALELCKSELHLKLSVMLDIADENLINQSGKNEPGNEHEDDSDDSAPETKDDREELIRILRTERNTIENAFLNSVQQNSVRDTSSQKEKPASRNNLSLIDQEEMDEMVALTAVHTNGINKYGEEVNNLAARLEHLELQLHRTLPKHTFDLQHICEAFQTALRQAAVSIPHRLVLYRLFDQDVSSRLGDMYKSLNQLFIEAGILPEVAYKVNNRESTTRPAQPDKSDGSVSADGTGQRTDSPVIDPGDEIADTQQENGTPGGENQIGRFFRQLMSGFSSAKSEKIPQSFSKPPSDPDSSDCYSRNTLMDAMSELQNSMTEVDMDEASGIDAEHIKREALATMSRSNGGAITKTMHNHDQQYIDFVGMIFHAIAEDESIPMVITNLLMLLQIPMIKIAMVDEEVFTEKDHPARITLDLVTKAGKGLTDVKDRVFVQLKGIVDSILQTHDIDRAVFENAVEELQSLITAEEEIAAQKEKAAQDEIIKRHARNIVLAEMRLITKQKVIPEATQPLMLKLWPTLMFNHYLKHGIESKEWLSSLKTFARLMEYLQPIRNKSQWQKLRTNHESLLKTVEDKLHETRQSRQEIDAQVAALEQTFKEMLDNELHQPEEEAGALELPPISASDQETDSYENSGEEYDDSEHEDKAARIQEQVRIAREKISRLPTNLHPGVWFEVFNGEDKPVRRLKLSVILTDAAQLIFVDRQGVKVLEKDAEEFLDELNHQKSRFIADHSTFEHALGSVIHTFAA